MHYIKQISVEYEYENICVTTRKKNSNSESIRKYVSLQLPTRIHDMFLTHFFHSCIIEKCRLVFPKYKLLYIYYSQKEYSTM